MNAIRLTSLLARMLVAGSLVASTGWGQVDLEDSWARKIMHYDESTGDLDGVTVAKKNPVEDTLEESTFSQHEILITRRVFQMDSQGRIRNGLIFDGKRNLLGRTEYGFDKWDRIEQERLYTKKGKLVRALLYRYDTGGNPVKPIAYTFDPSNPSSKKQITTDVEPILPASRHEDDYPGIKIRTSNTGNRAPTNNPLKGINGGGSGINSGGSIFDTSGNYAKPQVKKAKPKKKKRGFLKRLFGGSED